MSAPEIELTESRKAFLAKCVQMSPGALDGLEFKRAGLTPPKWLAANPVSLTAAYRLGVAQGIMMRERRMTRSYVAYVIADSGWLRFVDRVRIEWMRRHPAAPIPEGSAE